MIIPLKRKYRVYKPVKQNKAGSGHSGPSRTKKPGPKNYVYGSRVMVMYDAVKGKIVMMDGDAAYE